MIYAIQLSLVISQIASHIGEPNYRLISPSGRREVIERIKLNQVPYNNFSTSFTKISSADSSSGVSSIFGEYSKSGNRELLVSTKTTKLETGSPGPMLTMISGFNEYKSFQIHEDGGVHPSLLIYYGNDRKSLKYDIDNNIGAISRFPFVANGVDILSVLESTYTVLSTANINGQQLFTFELNRNADLFPLGSKIQTKVRDYSNVDDTTIIRGSFSLDIRRNFLPIHYSLLYIISNNKYRSVSGSISYENHDGVYFPLLIDKSVIVSVDQESKIVSSQRYEQLVFNNFKLAETSKDRFTPQSFGVKANDGFTNKPIHFGIAAAYFLLGFVALYYAFRRMQKGTF